MSSRSDRSTLLRRDWLNTTVQTDWSKTAPLVQGTVTALTEQTDLKHRTEPNRTLVSGPSQFTQSTSTNEFVFTHWNYLFGISGWSRPRTPPHTPLWVQSYPPVRPPLPCALPPPPPLPVSSLTRDMSDKAKHPIAPVELTTSTATQKQPPGVQLKVREENVSQGQREGGEGARWR